MRRRTTQPKPRGSAGSTEVPFVPPYPPSWFDRLSVRLDRLPVSPYWAYSLFGLAVFVLLTLVQWREGGTPPWEIRPFHIALAFWIPFNLGLMHYLDRLAAKEMETFRPALAATPEQARDLAYRLVTLPARTVARIGLAVVLGNVFLVLIDEWVVRPTARASMLQLSPQLFQVAPTALSLAVTAVLVVGLWWVSGTFVYHTAHQLQLIRRIYGRYTRPRLLHLGPLYSLSRITQRTAIGILLTLYAFLSSAFGFQAQPALLIASGILLTTIAGVTFAWPLVGVHQLLVTEKDRLLEENTRRLEAGIADLHQRMDRHDLSEMDNLNKALASLDLERSALARTPTWPWDPGTLRGLVAALLVPIIIWAIQLGAERLLP